MNAPAVSFEVSKRFHALRYRYRAVCIGTTMAMAMTGLLVLWLLISASDFVWELQIFWRKVCAVSGVSVIFAWLVCRVYLIWSESKQQPFASLLEQSIAEFGQRIRTVLDTVAGRASGPTEMLSALGHQTLGRWEISSPARLLPTAALVRWTLALLMVFMIVVAGIGIGGDWRLAMLRAMGGDLPYTRLMVTPGNSRILEKAPVEVSLELTGRIDRDVMLRHRRIEDPPLPWVESELLPVELSDGESQEIRKALFSVGLGKATHSLEYQFITGVGRTDVYRIQVQPLIDALGVHTVVEPPAYTRLPTRQFNSADITVLEKSSVRVTIETNHPLGKATLELGPQSSSFRAVDIPDGEDRVYWTFELPCRDSLHWRFSGTGVDGTPMVPMKGRLRVRKDEAPLITWQDPADEVRVHGLAELPMRALITDDYGIMESGIVFQIGGDGEYVLTDWQAAEAGAESTPSTTRLRLEELLPLESFALSERDYVSYYAYAVDNRGTGPQRAETDVRYIDIRPLRQYFSEVEREPGMGGSGRVLVQLDEIIRRERFLINRTRKILRSGSTDLSSQLGTIDRMVESQSELAGITRYLAEFFISRGNDDVEALSQAEASMLQASDSLAAGSFDLALTQEDDALRSLAEARRTLELAFIKNPTLAQQQEFRQLARQLQQKLRRERPETETEIADTLKRIASEQSQLGRDAMRQVQPSEPSGASTGRSAEPTHFAADSIGNSTQVPVDETAEEITDDAANDATDSVIEAPEVVGPAEDIASLSATEANQREQDLFAKQVDLLERVQALEEPLNDRLSKSPLMASRMQEVKEAMDALAALARESSLNTYAADSDDAAERLREIAIQLDALAAPEPLARISTIRDMTTSLANMESEFAEGFHRLGDSESTASGEANGQLNETLKSVRRHLRWRSDTIEDVLKAPVEVGDVETSEVNDYLQRFVEESGFMDQLASTRDATQPLAIEPGAGCVEAGQRAYQRAVEYADAAQQLDQLYRQLATPRLARLRQLETKANNLSGQLAAGGNADQLVSEALVGIRMLRDELEEEGMDDLAKLLDESLDEGSVPELDEGVPPMDEFVTARASVVKRVSTTGQHPLAGRVLLVVQELRAHIQEMILLEISVDRDTPVPSQYRTAVDRYFRVLADDTEATEGTNR